jgi:predicted Ser/Thr protein kinase
MANCPACSLEVDEAATRCLSCGALLTDTVTHTAAKIEPERPLLEFGPLGDARFAPGRIFASRYRIVSLLGRGGMGEVYRAEDLKLGQPVALKLMAFRSQRRRDDLQRFAAEVRLARQIAHPNICRVYDLGEAEGWQYLSMEYVDGETLASLVRRIGALPSDKVLDFARQLFAGVAAAHDRGVLHRDLKPSNVMVDGRGRIRIMDFGLAISADEMPRDRAGTPAYMAPEQLTGDRVTERTDLYALGLILYEVYAGRALFAGLTFYQRLRRVQHGELSTVTPSMDPRVAPLVSACLEEDPAARPASAAAVAAMLPGGDPLTAAVAEQRIVTPEMLAAASTTGALSLPTAWLLLSIATIGAIVVTARAEALLLPHAALPKPPAVLVERCEEILARIGHKADATDSDFWFAPSADRTVLYFVYRQSPRPLVARNLFRVIGETDPPATVPGMALVKADAFGRLVSLTRIGEPAKRSGDTTRGVGWSALFSDAGLDERQFIAVTSPTVPLVAHDTVRAWEHVSDERLRVTAATLLGEPVFFEVADPTSASMRDRTALTTGRTSFAEQILWLLIASAFVGMAVIARRNLRAGEGDRSSARKLGWFVACGGTLSGLLRAHHVPLVVEEIALLLGVAGWALVWAGFSWLAYISFEPYVRGLWPRTLISWTRLLAGRLRDPLVGRDVLIGTLIGIMLTGMLVVRFTFARASVPEPFAEPAIESLASGRLLGWSLLFGVLNGLQFALGALFFVVLIRMVVRERWLAVVILSVIAAPVAPGGVASLAGLAWAIGTAGIAVATVMRVGLLAGALAIICVHLFTASALTLNPQSWCFGSSIVILAVVIALAVYGFIVSLAGQPAFGVKR